MPEPGGSLLGAESGGLVVGASQVRVPDAAALPRGDPERELAIFLGSCPRQPTPRVTPWCLGLGPRGGESRAAVVVVSAWGPTSAVTPWSRVRPQREFTGAELADTHGVSDIVVRQALNLLRSQGLVRTIERRGSFVADQPTLIRVSPERQTESAEESFANESSDDVDVDRVENVIPATADIATALGVVEGSDVVHVLTRIEVDGRPVSISDSYERPADDRPAQLGSPRTLDETLTFGPPSESHAEYLGLGAGDVTVAINQRFQTGDRVDMVTDVTYQPDRYSSFVFRMALPADDE